MANLTETPTYEAGIYRFETTDPVQGGPGGIDNLPTNQLANRTAWLKAQVEAILLDIAAIESGYATAASLAGHTGNTSNPHAVTKAQVGLGSVENYGVASQAEAEAGTIHTKYLTPLRARQALFATFGGGNRSLFDGGFQRLADGMIIQWGADSTIGVGPKTTVFPVAFPNAVFRVVVGAWNNNSAAAEYSAWLTNTETGLTTSGFKWSSNGAGSPGINWIAIGY